MKEIKLIIVLLLVNAGFIVSAQVSVTGTAYTEIVPLISVVEEVQMNLGRFSVTNEGGSVTLLPDGTRFASGATVLSEGIVSQGVFTITGSNVSSLNVLLPVAPVPLYHHSTAGFIHLVDWTNTISRKQFGSVSINIGATLKLKSVESNPHGLYSGRYQVNIVFD